MELSKQERQDDCRCCWSCCNIRNITDSIKSAVSRKRAAGNVGPKPTNVKTIVKKKTRRKNKR